ncbi:apolipophorin [Plakobranchus ocellatus]|uniref:Apolipophorin n=1 Tax=Plakobranchus ocellatus TaxID=259542 RepID=A0AAV4A8P4_9GAST|nr:apolipophorin [Plakobranchus ocellatus]
MTSLIIRDEVPKLQARSWISSLAFIPAPISEMLVETKRLLDSEKYREDALLPVSSMVNNFCSRSKACDQSYAVLSIMASLERQIPDGCDASGKDFLKILMTLRAIGNAGHAKRAVPKIISCLTNSANPLEIRVAAVNAFRRMPCDAENTALWRIYGNSNEDSELQVTAYLALMRCPTFETLSKMAESLNGDLDEHVGAFVYSHLTNLKQTSDPHKQDVVRSMESLVIPNKYASNPLKASTNVEFSALINKINTGFVAEKNLIWSNNAQLPRSASANLTVELFGQSINLVDFGGRLEGLEKVIKNTWGKMWGNVEKEKNKLHGSVYGRIFGNELLFLHSKQMKYVGDSFYYNWLDMLITLAENQEFSYTHSAQIMDVSMIIPSVAGLPINMDVNGSAVVDLVMKGKADLRKFSSSPRSVDIEGEIRPSGALEITGTMSVDAFVTKTGLRMRNTLHSSTALKGHIHIGRGESLSIELESPQEKMEIFDARSKFFIVHNNVEQEQKMVAVPKEEYNLCSCSKLADITGAKLCGHISYPNASMQSDSPYFPLTGPSSASLVLHKTDTHSGYKLFAKRVENKKTSTVQISFNTPGSKINRVIMIDMSVNYPRKSIDAQVVTPWKKADFSGYAINKDKMKTISGSLTIDNSHVYAVTSEVKINQHKKKLHLTPLVEIRRPGADTIKLTGEIVKTGNKALQVELSLAGLKEQPYTFNSHFINGLKEKSLMTSVSADGGESEYSLAATSLLSFAEKKKKSVINVREVLEVKTPKHTLIFMDVSADYREDKSLKLNSTLGLHKIMKKPASLLVVMNKVEKKRSIVYKMESNVKTALFSSSLNSMVNSRKYGSGQATTTKSILDYTIPKVAKNRIIASGKFIDKSTKSYTKYIAKGNVEVKKNPEYNVGVNFDFDHKKKHCESELVVKYGRNHKDPKKRLYLNTILNKKRLSYKNLDVHYKIVAKAPEQDIDAILSGKHTHNPTTLDSHVNFNYAKDKDCKAKIFLKNKSNKKTKIHGHATVGWPGAEYVLTSKFDQESKRHYTHEIHLKSDTGVKHSIETDYKMPRSDQHEVVAKVNFQGMRKLRVYGSTNLDDKKPSATGEIQYGKDIYGLSTIAKLQNKQGEVIVEMKHPERRMLMKVEGEKARHQYDGSIEASWDADNDKNKKISLSGSVFNKKSKDVASMGGEMNLKTPFENFENLATVIKYGNDRAQHDMEGKVSWAKHKHVHSKLTLKKPISLKYLSATFETNTPFKKMKKISADISHSWDNSLNTIIKGNVGKENAKLVIENVGDLDKFNGKVIFSSTIKDAEEISTTFSHTSTPKTKNTNVLLSKNGEIYRLNLDMDHEKRGWKLETNGELTLKAPKSKMVASWNHKHGDNLIKSKAELIENGKRKAMSDVNYSNNGNDADFDFAIISPFHNDISGKLNTKYGSYPMTSYGELQWHPRKRVTTSTSLNAENWDDSNVEVTLTTPVRGYKNVNLRASNKKDGAETTSNAVLEYGENKSIFLQTRHILNDQNKMVRVKLNTPFEKVKSLDTGFSFDGKVEDFESSADFALEPVIGKFQGSAKWRYDDEMTGTLRLDTPYPEHPYFELSTSSKIRDRLRRSHIEARLHPQQVYSIDTSYAFDLPISFEANLKSPYPEYDDMRVFIQHDHSPSRIASHGEVRYHADKTIETDLSADWSSNIEGSLTVKTPFTGYESNTVVMRHRGGFKQFSTHGEVNVAQKSVVADASYRAGYTSTGEFTLLTPISGMEKLKLNVMKKGKAKNFKGEIKLRVNDEKSEVDYHHRYTKETLKSSFVLTTPYTKNIRVTLNHKGDLTEFTNDISANYGYKYKVSSDVTFGLKPQIKGDGTFKYKLGKRQNTAKLSFFRDGPIEDMTFRANAGLNDDEIKVSGLWKSVNGIKAVLDVDTPFKDFKDIKIETHNTFDDDYKDINTHVSITSTIKDFGKGDFTLSKTGDLNDLVVDGSILRNRIELANIRIINKQSPGEIHSTFTSRGDSVPETEVKFDHSGPLDSFETTLNAKVDNKEILDSMVSYEQKDKSANTQTTIRYDDQKEISINGKLKLKEEVSGSLKINTPIEGYKDVGMSFTHNGEAENFETEGNLNFVDGEQYKGKVDFSRNDNTGLIDATVELHTPIQDNEFTKLTFRHEGKVEDFTNVASVEYGDQKKISYDLTASTSPKIDLKVVIKTPFENFEDLTATSVVETEWPKLSLISKASAGLEKQFSLDAALDASDSVSGYVDVKTPVTDFTNIGMSFDYSSTSEMFGSEAKVTYMDGKDVSGKITLANEELRGLVGTAELNTPFDFARSTRAEVTLDTTSPSYSVSYNINYGDNEASSANANLNVYSTHNIDGLLEVRLPVDGFEFTKAEYQHRYDTGRIEGTAAFTYGDSNTISGELRASKDPYCEGTVTFKTPFEGYEHTQWTASYENSADKYGMSSSLSLSNYDPFSVTSSLDMSAEPLRGSLQISTPYEGYRNMELAITHEGSMYDFQSTGFLTTPMTDEVNAAASLKYNAPFDMEASASLKSSLNGMDNLAAYIKSTDEDDQKKTHAVVGWTDEKQIMIDAIVNKQKTWYEENISGELSMSTPFPSVEHLVVQGVHNNKQNQLAQTATLELNGEKLLDLDTEYNPEDKHQTTVTFRKPRPMKYTVTGTSEAGATDVEIVANWNRNEVDSNVRITASINDQSDSYKTDRTVDLGVEHASRKMGVHHKLSSSALETTSSGKIHWDSDESSKLSYDMEVKDNSRRNEKIVEGFFNLGLPYQTLGLSGSHSDGRVKRKGDLTFSWDTDRPDRQIGIKATMTKGDRVKGDITLTMPALRKEIRMDGEISVQNGRVILDARTDISYSTDSRKTLTLTSKLEDISDYYSRYNYSLAVGVSHPYTNVDIQMTSHLGSSDEKMTVGLSTDYMTARRQNKNLGLLAEINKLKKQISLQVTNPINKVEIIGDVISDSPCKMRIIKKVDDRENFRSDLTIDAEKKSVELNIGDDTDGLKVTAGYPKHTVYHSEISRIKYGLETTEALLAVRLNTSRLLHTRLHWNPGMTQRFLEGVRDSYRDDVKWMTQTMEELSQAVSEEIVGKYKDITEAFNEEVRPLIDELDNELQVIVRQLYKLSRSLRKAQEDNDFYIQDMNPTIKKAYRDIQLGLVKFTKEFRKQSEETIKSLKDGLDKMVKYPIQERCDEVARKSSQYVEEQMKKVQTYLEKYLTKIDEALTEYRDGIRQIQKSARDTLNNATHIIDYLSDIDVRQYIPTVNMKIPEEYKEYATAVQGRIGYLLDIPSVCIIETPVKVAVNEVYQKCAWAYNYWQVEENIHKHTQSILKLIEEIVQDELKQYIEELERVYHPITVWDPEHGEIQAEFQLPVDVERLDQVPDVSRLTDQVAAYLPDAYTLSNVSENMPQVWSPMKDGDVVLMIKEVKRFKPSRTRQRRGRRQRWNQ